MRLSHIAFHIGALALSAIASAGHAIALGAVRLVDALLAIMPVEKPLALSGGSYFAASPGGQALDPALREDMRHESRTSRIAADRHT